MIWRVDCPRVSYPQPSLADHFLPTFAILVVFVACTRTLEQVFDGRFPDFLEMSVRVSKNQGERFTVVVDIVV